MTAELVNIWRNIWVRSLRRPDVTWVQRLPVAELQDHQQRLKQYPSYYLHTMEWKVLIITQFWNITTSNMHLYLIFMKIVRITYLHHGRNEKSESIIIGFTYLFIQYKSYWLVDEWKIGWSKSLLGWNVCYCIFQRRSIQYQILKSSLLKFELLLKLHIFFCRNFYSRLGNPFTPPDWFIEVNAFIPFLES